MAYSALEPKKLPPQNRELLLLLIERWQRAAAAMDDWAVMAKQCVDMAEGRQWDAAALIALGNRPAVKINKINRLVRLMMGYFSNNRIDIKYLPGHAGSGTEAMADVLTAIGKNISAINQLPYVDTEVFMDGILTGRGYYDQRISFTDNDLGTAKYRGIDPFTVRVDPDAQTYDPNDECGWAYYSIDRMASIDEVEVYYGKEARDAVEPFVHGQTPLINYLPASMGLGLETTPIRRFGHSDDSGSAWWDNVYSRLGSFYDPARKTLRVMDFQHKILTQAKVFIDLETGDRRMVPDGWANDRIQKCVYWCQANGIPVEVAVRPMQRIRWTTIIGDVMVYDDWSPYSTYSLTPFFPYFRRGITRGMVEDLIDPQKEINKRRSARIDAAMRTPHSGWKYHEGSMDPVQERRLKTHGGEAGFQLKWKGQQWMEPKKIEPSAVPGALRELELQSGDDLHEVSGINESAMGELDIAQSGKAIEARQRQAVIAIQPYMTNMSRTKSLMGYKQLELVQEHYTERRLFRVLGENGQYDTHEINKQIAVGQIVNNVTTGDYDLEVTERPMAASFESAQFEEMMTLLEKLGPVGQMLAQTRPDLIVDASSIPRKEEFKQALSALAGIAPPGQPGPGGQPPPSTGQGQPQSPAPGQPASPQPNNVVALRQ